MIRKVKNSVPDIINYGTKLMMFYHHGRERNRRYEL